MFLLFFQVHLFASSVGVIGLESLNLQTQVKHDYWLQCFFAPCNFCPWSSTFVNSCARSQICPQLWLNRDITRHWDSPSLKFTNWQLRRKGQKYNGGKYFPVYSNMITYRKKLLPLQKLWYFLGIWIVLKT